MDGNCDDDNNNKGCGYDGGDCCYKTVKGGQLKKNYCKQCKCIDPNNLGEPPATCGLLQYKGDTRCDDENNNKGCGWDGGDCCPKTVAGGTVLKDHCSQCKCLDPDNLADPLATCGTPKYKGDGNCDDDNNNKGCE